jgi:threonyl-tRNA synthetase
MKLLLIHSDFIEYEVKEKAISHPEETKTTKDRLDEALTVFIAVEKIDEKSPQQSVAEASKEISHTAELLKVKNIMLYPYAHLSSELASAKAGKEILIQLEQEVKNRISR